MALLFTNDFLTIDVGFRYIKIAQVRKKKNSDLTIVNYGIGDTPRGCIKNGAIKDKERVTIEIQKVINEHNLSAKEARIVISGTNIITRIIMIDRVDSENAERAIINEIKSYLPINLDEHMIDYKILGDVTEDGKEKTKVFITAVPKKIIESYVEILKDLKLKPVSVDIPANSVSKFFKKNLSHKEADNWLRKQRNEKLRTNTVAVIDLGSETTIINILKNRTPEFNRVLLIGSSNVDNQIFNDVIKDKYQMDKAERYKKMYGIVNVQDPNNDLEWQCSNSTKKVINEVLKNIKMCFDFYTSRCAGEQVCRIYLIGGGSEMKGLREYFEEMLNIPTYPVKVVEIDGIEFNANLDTEKVNYLINALGIAL